MIKHSKEMGRAEKQALAAMFGLFGFGVMTLGPRMPDIKYNLGVSNGIFGMLLSSGSIGALVSLLTMGHIVHRIGVKPVLLVSTFTMYGTLAIMVHLHNPFIYLILNLLCGASWSSYHIAVNAQAFHRQKDSGQTIIPFMHGFWTAGALGSAVVASLVARTIPITWHVDTLVTVDFIVTMFVIYLLRDVLLQGREITDSDGVVTLKDMAKSFKIDWFISIAVLCSQTLETMLGDWGSIFAREEIGVNASLAVLPYIFFMGGMIFGRISFGSLSKHWSEQWLIRIFPLVGGLTFAIFMYTGYLISKNHQLLGFVIVDFAFLVGGVGISFLGPLFLAIAGRRSDRPSGVIVAEIGALNQILNFAVRILLAWTIHIIGLPMMLVIPALMLAAVTFFAAAGKA